MMKRIYIIIIAVVVVTVVIGLAIGLQLKGFVSSGDIGVVEVSGVISSSKRTVKDLKNFKDDPAIQAIILRVDSPGGGVAASQEIYEEVKKARENKKVVVSMGAIAASGGYYISLPADLIVANPGTMTGSVGVIMEFPMLEGLMKKLGIDFTVIKSKEHKDIGSPYRKMTDKEKKLLQDVVLDVYDQFVSVTAECRNLPKDSVLKYADGRILSGHQAKEIGFVDTLGSLEDAVKITGDLIGIEKPRLVYPPKRISFIEYLIRPAEQIFLPRLNFLWK